MTNKYGIVICHMHDKLLQEQVFPYEGKNLINKVNTLISFGTIQGFPIIFTGYKKWGSLSKDIKFPDSAKIFMGKSLRDCYFPKKAFEFAQSEIKDGDIEGIILAGIFADACMGTTAKDISQYGFKILSSQDLTDNRVAWGVQQLRNHLETDVYGHPPFGKFFKSLEELIRSLK